MKYKTGRKKLTPQDDALIKKLYEQNKGYVKISKETGFSSAAIRICLIRTGIVEKKQVSYEKYSEREINFIKTNYKNLGRKVCADTLKISESRVFCIAKKFGIDGYDIVLDENARERQVKPPFRYNVNHEDFLNVNDPVKAYILGLLWADGFVDYSGKEKYKDYYELRDTVILGVTEPDVFEFEEYFKRTGNWIRYKTRKGNPNHLIPSSLYTNNFYLAREMYKLGYCERPNGFEKILNFIPKGYHNMFLLGFSDGDGSIEKFNTHRHKPQYRFSYASCYEQDWTGVENVLKGLGVEYVIVRGRTDLGGNSRLIVRRNESIKKWLNWLYKDYPENAIALKRKYNRYLEFKKLYDTE